MPDIPSDKEYDQEPPDPSPDFIKGFNEGYLLSVYAPEIGGVFGAYAPESERGKGFREGKQQYAYEDKSEPPRDKTSEHRDNQKSMGIKETPEQKMEAFQQNKAEQGLAKQRYPDWLKEKKDENKEDMDLDREPEKDKGDIEPELE